MSDLSLHLRRVAFDTKLASNKTMNEQQSIMSIIDKSLKHLNQISVNFSNNKQANIVAQELYIQLLKEKKTMKFDQIKKIYLTLTQGKAKQILFQRDKQELKKTDYQNHEGLVRLCWRSIQKLIKKITYYMVNENNLSPISKSVLNLIQLNQHFVRRTHKLKNSSMNFVIQIMEKLIQQNSILQKKIYDILLNRGYVVSLDQFYKLNGYDAQHRDTYQAKSKSDNQLQTPQEEENIPQIESTKTSTNFKGPFGRKKKVFKFDSKYSWKQNIVLQENQQKKSFPVNKTNFQIRQSFQKFIGDFLQNQNLKEVLLNYKHQQNTQNERKNSQTKKKDQLNEEGIIQKKIFQNKIESVITQLKSNNIKINSKLLQIIDDSSTEAINSKFSSNDRRSSERKNSYKRESSLISQRKLRESYLMNERKLVNQNLYRELLKRNESIQNQVHQEVQSNTNKIKTQESDPQNKQNKHVIEFSIIEHNQNSTQHYNPKSRFSDFLQNKTIMFKSQNKIKQQNSCSAVLKRNFKVLQSQMSQKYNLKERIKPQEVEGVRIVKQDWYFKNEKQILEAIQQVTIDPLNSVKIDEIIHFLNDKKELKIDPLLKELFSPIQENSKSKFEGNKYQRLKTQNGQRIRSNPKIRDMTNDFDPSVKRAFSRNIYQRIKTQNSPRRITEKEKQNIFETSKINNKLYEVFDRRMRRVIRR